MANDSDKINSSMVPVIGISRHRIGVDGKGVTTLVAFHGCPLHCKYCLNPEALGSDEGLMRYTPESLLEAVMIDDLYFRATGGGICFGGGEPLQQVDFIARFMEICPPEWRVTVETSLHVGEENLMRIAPIIDHWIVDIKAGDPEVYERYTGERASRVVQNLKLLTVELNIPRDSFTIRVPVIPGYVSEEQAERTAQEYREEFPDVEVFRYITERPDRASRRMAVNRNGKEKCEFFKSVRRELAQKNGIDASGRECTHKGECSGTCPLCDFELEALARELEALGVSDMKVSDRTMANLAHLEDIMVNRDDESAAENDLPPEDGEMLQGDIAAPEPEGQIPQGLTIPPDDPESDPEFEPEPERAKVLFKECAVAGVSFHLKYDDELWSVLEKGQRVALVRHRKNGYDMNAVAVALYDDYDGDADDFDFDAILGYIPRSENEEIAKMLDMGWEDMFYVELSTVSRSGRLNDRLRISIYIQSKDPVRPEGIRVYAPDRHEWLDTLRELEERGTAHFRWGGFPVWGRNLPKLGSRIVVVRNLSTKVILLDMRVIAVGDDCVPFVDDPQMVHAVDDRVSFVLANAFGPVTVDKRELEFLEGSLDNNDCEQELSLPQTDQLKQLLHKAMWSF